MSSNNLHLLFNGNGSEPSLRKALRLFPEEDAALVSARKEVRAVLRSRLPALIKEALPHLDKQIVPRFFTQGSHAYKTIIRPCHPGQQIDMDDGCYLPMTFVEEFTVAHASDVFFRAVEIVLEPLAAKNNWTMVTDKKTCVRLELDKTKHIDIPLYAIPDDEFKRLVETAALRYQFNKADIPFDDESITWDMLPKGKVLLAMRGGSWKSSDPRPVADWVKLQAATKGEQWREVVRYLKAWRDFQWPAGGPSSILLMAAVDRVFSRSQDRIDLALLEVVKELQSVLAREVLNPAADEYEDLSLPLNENGLRQDVIRRLGAFQLDLYNAIYSTPANQACTLLQHHLGGRFPLRPDLVTAVTPRDEVKSTTARLSSAAPMIQSTRSG